MANKKNMSTRAIEEMTIYNADIVKQEIFYVLTQQRGLTLDLSEVTEIDTAGFQAVLFGKRYAEQNDLDLKLKSPSVAVEEVFKLYGMNDLLENRNES